MRRYTLLRLLPMMLVVLALVGLGVWLVPQLRAPQGRTYRFYIEDASGLPEGTEVKFRGLLVGQVIQGRAGRSALPRKEEPVVRGGVPAGAERRKGALAVEFSRGDGGEGNAAGRGNGRDADWTPGCPAARRPACWNSRWRRGTT